MKVDCNAHGCVDFGAAIHAATVAPKATRQRTARRSNVRGQPTKATREARGKPMAGRLGAKSRARHPALKGAHSRCAMCTASRATAPTQAKSQTSIKKFSRTPGQKGSDS